MRAFVITGPGTYEVCEVEPPQVEPGLVVIDVERAGVCGTDVEVLTGHMAYLENGDAQYPMRIGHEWCGRVRAVGDGVDPAWIGKRVTADTMLGCGSCRRCLAGRHNICADRFEIGLRRGWPGALAEQVAAPARFLYELPSSVDATCGAMVEPGANAWRAVDSTGLPAGSRLVVIGSGTIGLLCAQFAAARGVEVHVLGVDPRTLALAETLGVAGVWTASEIGDVIDLGVDAVIDASTADTSPAAAIDLVVPGGRVVFIGYSPTPSMVDTRRLMMKDLTVVGVLAGSFGLAGAISAYATGAVDPRPLVAATVALGDAGEVLQGMRPASAGPGPKMHIDPQL